jgi:hypothetical protein
MQDRRYELFRNRRESPSKSADNVSVEAKVSGFLLRARVVTVFWVGFSVGHDEDGVGKSFRV